jgi:Spy/CpxP family protein refolding chaperone
MKQHHVLFGLVTSLAFSAAGMAQSQNPPPPSTPGTHVDSTVVGDARADTSTNPGTAVGLDNDHHFEAGAPHLTEMATQLGLSVQQKAQLTDIIERGDAGAAVLIKREHNVKDMLEKTKPEDPRYRELVNEQDGAQARWQTARDAVHREILAILTPAQRVKFEQLRAERQASSSQ